MIQGIGIRGANTDLSSVYRFLLFFISYLFRRREIMAVVQQQTIKTTNDYLTERALC